LNYGVAQVSAGKAADLIFQAFIDKIPGFANYIQEKVNHFKIKMEGEDVYLPPGNRTG